MNLPEDFSLKKISGSDLEASDAWILNRFNQCLADYEKAYSEYHFYEMAASIYDFIWGDLCDWYIELVKPRIYGKSGEKSLEVARQTLVHVLLSALNLLHPFMPFITEEIHSAFAEKDLTNSDWSKPFSDIDSKKVEKLSILIEIVSKVRVVRADQNIPPDKKCKVIVKSSDLLAKEIVEEERLAIMQLSRAEELTYNAEYSVEKSDSVAAFSKGEIILPLSGMIDFKKEQERLTKEKTSLESEMEKVNRKLTNPEFISKAKPEVIAKEKEKIEGLKSKLETVIKSLEKLG